MLRGLLNVPEENLGPQPAAPAIVECAQEEEPEELPPEDLDFNTAVAGFEKKLLEQVLKESSNLREASRKLNINASTICRRSSSMGLTTKTAEADSNRKQQGPPDYSGGPCCLERD